MRIRCWSPAVGNRSTDVSSLVKPKRACELAPLVATNVHLPMRSHLATLNPLSMPKYRFSGFEIDAECREIRRYGYRVPLQPQPFLILLRLVESAGRVVTREELIHAIWGGTHLASPGHSLNIAVRKLRDALGDSTDEPRLIQTVAGHGYRFIADVERTDQPPAGPVPGPVVPDPPPAARTRRYWPAVTGLGLVLAFIAAWLWVPLPPSMALQARARPTESPRAKLLWDNALDVGGRVSSDGRYFSYTDWKSPDVGLALRDLLSGVNRKLTRMPPWTETRSEVGGSAVSPDGTLVAFARHRYSDKASEESSALVLIGADGQGQRVLLQEPGLSYVDPYSWSHDGRLIAASVVYRRKPEIGKDAIALVSVPSGHVRHLPVRSDEWAYNVFFSPDGKYLAYSIAPRSSQPTLLIRPLDSETSPETVIQTNAMMMGWAPDGKGLLFSRPREGVNDLYFLPVVAGLPSGEPTPIYAASDVGRLSGGVTGDGTLVYSTYNRRAEALILPQHTGSSQPLDPIASMSATTGIGWLLGPGAAHFSPKGRSVFTVTPLNSIAIRDLNSGTERTIIPQLKTWRAARWSHDGTSLLLLGSSADGGHGVFRVDEATGEASLLTSVPAETWAFVTSRDGRTLFFGTPLKTKARNLVTGVERVLLESPNGGNYDLRVSRLGDRLAIRGGSYLAVVDLTSGRSRVIY